VLAAQPPKQIDQGQDDEADDFAFHYFTSNAGLWFSPA
jgi:hypothetical protein